MRTVTIDMSVDQQHPICSFGGYAGENKETKLVVILPERMLKDTYRKYRFDFQTILNEQISSTMIDRENLQGGNAVQVILWNQLMPQDGDLKFCVSAFEAAADGGADVVVQGKTALITLKIGKSVGGAYTPIDVKANADELQTMIKDTIDDTVGIKSAAQPEKSSAPSAGSKAYLITACDQTAKTFTLDGVYGLAVGDVYSITASGYANVEDVGKITAINGKVVTVDHLPVENGVGYGNAVPKSDALPENFPQGLAAPYFRIIAKPTVGSQSIGTAALAGGISTEAQMDTSFVTGKGSKSVGKYGVAMGNKNTAYYSAAAIGGGSNKAFGKNSAIISGSSNQTNGYAAFVGGGQKNEIDGACAFATGSWNKVPGFNAAAFGLYNESHGQNDFVTGYKNIVNGYCAAAFGLAHNIKGKGNFATGQGNGAKEGAENCFITGQGNLAENASGCILAGSNNTVSGESVDNKILHGVMLGRNNKVTGHYGVAAGYNNVANTQSVALGLNNVADVWRAFALGTGLKAKYMDQVAVGSFNAINSKAAFIVGNGTSDTARSNAFVVNKDGSAEVGKQGTKDLSVATMKDLKEKVPSVDDALSDTSTNPVQNKVIKSALDSKLEVKKLTVTDNTLSRAQLAALDAGIYEVDLTPTETGIPALAVGVNELTSTGETGPKTIYCYSGTNTVKIKVERYYQEAGLRFSLRISSACFCMSYDPYMSGVFHVIELANDIISPSVPDKLTDFVTTDTLSNYQQKDYVARNLTTTSPALSLTSSIKNSIYQYSNVLTSLTITVPTTPINLDQSIRLIFKATSATTITVPSGLYFRGDDCNDSYVFIPQDNKVYDIIITYDGFNYNGIVVGTPATR